MEVAYQEVCDELEKTKLGDDIYYSFILILIQFNFTII